MKDWLTRGRALGAELKKAGVRQELIDALDDHILDSLWRAFCAGSNAVQREQVTPKDLIATGLAVPLGQDPEDDSDLEPRIAGAHEFKDMCVQARRRDHLGRLK